MSDVLKTILVNGENGPIRINEADFNEKEHKLYKPKKSDEPVVEGITPTTVIPAPAGVSVPPTPSTPPQFAQPGSNDPLQPMLVPGAFTPPAAPQNTPQTITATADQKLVSKIGKKFFVVNVSGEKIVADGIDDKNGYDSEALAWAAVLPAGSPAQSGAENAGNAS